MQKRILVCDACGWTGIPSSYREANIVCPCCCNEGLNTKDDDCGSKEDAAELGAK